MINIKKKQKKLTLAQKINVLRASVMGANDGIISVAGIVLGVAGASSSTFAILISGFAGMLAGTISMAMGEYVSVHSQSDAEIAAVERERCILDEDYHSEFSFIKNKLMSEGISDELSQKATKEMMSKDSLKVIVREKYGFELDEKTNPYAAAIASMVSFPLGAALPLLSILVFPLQYRIIGTMIAVVISLIFTGYFAAGLSHSSRLHGTIRNVISGMLIMIVTYLIGTIFSL